MQLDSSDDILLTDLVRNIGSIPGRFGLMDEIARQGCTVIVPFREEMAKRHLKVTGDLGRVIFMVGWTMGSRNLTLIFGSQEYDLRNTQSLEESVRHSDVVYNLVGRMYPTKYVWTGFRRPRYMLRWLGTSI